MPEATQCYFTASPTTPSASPSPSPAASPSGACTPTRSVSSRGAGAEFYIQHMQQNYWRRLKKGASPPPADGAGLLCGSRYHGRGTPLKGHGAPPPDQKEQIKLWTTKTKVVGKSHAAVKDLLEHPDGPPRPMTAGPYESMRFSADTTFRPCMKPTPLSWRSHMEGASMTWREEEPVRRAVRKAGDARPQQPSSLAATEARVLCVGDGLDSPASPLEGAGGPLSCKASAQVRWDRQNAAAAELAGRMELERPKTAPALSEARKYYHADATGHNDVFRYRYSGGICPPEYKFMGTKERVAPYEPTKTANAAEAWTDARMAFAYNRVRSLISQI